MPRRTGEKYRLSLTIVQSLNILLNFAIVIPPILLHCERALTLGPFSYLRTGRYLLSSADSVGAERGGMRSSFCGSLFSSSSVFSTTVPLERGPPSRGWPKGSRASGETERDPASTRPGAGPTRTQSPAGTRQPFKSPVRRGI